MKIKYTPIGVIHSPHTEPEKTPAQPKFAKGIEGRVEVFPEYAEGLEDLDGFSHVFLVFHFHECGEPKLKFKPYLDDVERGVFATRAPCRPNPIGFSVCRLVSREGNILRVEDVDILDGTPLLDIKPVVDRFDRHEDLRCGWMDEIEDEQAGKRGLRGYQTEPGE